MATITLEHKPSLRKLKVEIDIDIDRWERLASSLGLFNKEFIESIQRAESEIKQGKTYQLRNFRNIRRR